MHKNKPLPYLCYACDYRTYTKFYMDQHEKVEHKTEDFTCDTCGYKTKHQHAIKRHLKYVHDDSRNFQCEVCAKSVKTHKQANALKKAFLKFIYSVKATQFEKKTPTLDLTD